MASQFNCLISKIEAEEIKDSHGAPTIKVTVWAGASSDSFSVPSGVSTGIYEACELRDEDGKGVKKSIDRVNNIIAASLIGFDVRNQKKIDEVMIKLDGTPNKSNLGGNSMIGVSIACAKVAAKVTNQEIYQHLRTLAKIKPSRKAPYLFMNLIEGGKHTNNGLSFQEYHIVPQIDDIKEAIEIGIKVQDTLKEIIIKNLGEESTALGDEGGFAPKINDIQKPFLYLTEAINKNNLQNKVRLALDVAASSFYENGSYRISGEQLSKEELMAVYNSLIKEFNLISIEDPFNEEDFESFRKLKEQHQNFLVVGDDLTVSNLKLLQKAIKNSSINGMIVKPNQIGTLSETLEVMKLARENGIELIVSHRGEETDDDFIADLAFAFNCFGLKSGSPKKPERMVKYKRLMNIINSQGNPV